MNAKLEFDRIEVDGNVILDITPLLRRSLVEDEGWSKDEIAAKMSDLVGPDWEEIHASEWGQRLEDKGLMTFDESKSRDLSRPEYVMVDEFTSTTDRNEGVYEAIVRIIGHGPMYNEAEARVKAKAQQEFIVAMTELRRLLRYV